MVGDMPGGTSGIGRASVHAFASAEASMALVDIDPMTSAVSDDLLRTVPLGRIAEPEEIAAAAWLYSPKASYAGSAAPGIAGFGGHPTRFSRSQGVARGRDDSYITGSVLVADGGWLAG